MILQALGGLMRDADTVAAAVQGARLATITMIATVALECTCLKTVRAVWKQENGVSLYRQAVLANFVNHYVIGVPVYVVAVFCFMRELNELSIFRVVAILTVHSLQYYNVHKLFHENSRLYRFHRFHHRFKENVPPMSANAVSIVEYFFAYILAFTVAAILVNPSEIDLRIAILIISFCNLGLHTPWLDAVLQWPEFWVSPGQHQTHHSKLNKHYAAPTFNIDWAVEKITAFRAS